MGTALSVLGLEKSYGERGREVRAVSSVSFDVPEGSFYTLLGPSGCGKTTTLRCVAGLERPNQGSIWLAGECMSAQERSFYVPPHKRDIGMVFQSYAIWPHMLVFDNVAFPLRAAKLGLSRIELERRVGQALRTVELDGYEGRNATQLSGGQQQRLALARALVREPKLLLLDEPLSNLDAKLRVQMRKELRSLQASVGITTLYVTHDQTEALAMSDAIAVMSEGEIVQEGSPEEIYQEPATRFVAEFVGSANFVPVSVVGDGYGEGIRVQAPWGELVANAPYNGDSGGLHTLSIRPERVEYRLQPSGKANEFHGRVVGCMFLGERLELQVRAGEIDLTVRAEPACGLRSGDSVWVRLPPEACNLVAESGGGGAR